MSGSQRFQELDREAQRKVIREAIRLDLEERDDLLSAAREAGISEASIRAALEIASPAQRKSLRELMPVLAVFWAVAIWIAFAFDGMGNVSMSLWLVQIFAIPVLSATLCEKRKMATGIAAGTAISGVVAFVTLLGWPVNDRSMLMALPFLSAALAAGLHVLLWKQRGELRVGRLT